MLASMLLELSKQLVNSNKSFHLQLNTKYITFRFTSKDRDIFLPAEKKIKKKSPSQKKRDYQMRKTFLEHKSNNSENFQEQVSVVNKPDSENSALKDTCFKLHNLNFKCDLCDYTSSSNYGVNVHMGRSHKGSKTQENLCENSY